MRIAYLVPAPGIPVRGPSGASAHVRGLAGGLAQDHELRLFAALEQDRRGRFGEDPPALTALGAPGWPSWLDGWRDLREVRAARRISRHLLRQARGGWRPELLLERHSLFSDAGWRLHDALDLPWVLEVNAPPCLERGRFERLRRPALAARWERRVLQAAPAIVTVSHWLADWLVQEHGCRAVTVVPNGVTPARGDRQRGRRLLGLGEDEPVIGFVGSMKAWHGVGRLVRVAQAVGARLALVGERRDPATFLDIGQSLPEDLIWTDHLAPQGLADVVAALDVGLAPYPADAPPWFCPLKVLDYRAQGTPVVGTDVGDTRRLVGEAGTVVPPEDDEALIEAVRAWLGRRTPPWVRSWRQVGVEILAAAGLPATGPG